MAISINITVDYRKFVTYAEKYGLQKTLEYCQKKYPELELYDINHVWLETNLFTCCCEGRKGKLIIFWG